MRSCCPAISAWQNQVRTSSGVAAEIAGTDPPQCYFVDDTAINVAAAHDLGFHTHTFRNAPQLVATLAWTGIGDSG